MLNGAGIVVVLLGSSLYSYVSQQEKISSENEVVEGNSSISIGADDGVTKSVDEEETMAFLTDGILPR
jgi:hypothetical protein